MSTRPFRFSVQASNTSSGTAWTELARKTEAQGYSTLCLPDHYVDAKSNGGQGIAAIPAMAAAAAVTDTLRVGARVLCVDYHHPVVLAKQATTIDLLSGGRLELGLGAGWVRSEYEAMGLEMDPPPARIKRLADTVDFLREYFTAQPLEVRSTNVTAAGFSGQPAPVQQPGPPLMIGGGAPRVLGYAGQVADIVSVNFNNRAGRVGPDGVASSSAAAMDDKIGWIRAGAGDRFDSIELEIGAYFTVVGDQPQAAAEQMGQMFGLSAEEMREHPNALMGSVEDICEQLVARRERYGFSYISVGDRNADAFAPVVARLAGT
jgi:probable F420-dependent oxidoreductase